MHGDPVGVAVLGRDADSEAVGDQVGAAQISTQGGWPSWSW
ncbi:hypothetical protein ACQEUV_17325 [Micromonospora aurantiaca (nom. illeg.)]